MALTGVLRRPKRRKRVGKVVSESNLVIGTSFGGSVVYAHWSMSATVAVLFASFASSSCQGTLGTSGTLFPEED
jgi:hypothetical protein